MKVLFFGSSKFSINSLILLHNDSSIEIVGVVTKKDKVVGRGNTVSENVVAKKAKELGVKVKKVASLRKNPAQIDPLLEKSDYTVVVSFGYILPKSVLDKLPQKFINLHASLLPKYRGASPIHQSIINGDTIAGNTIMIIDEKVDSGPILSQQKVDIGKDETIVEVSKRLSQKGAKLLLDTLKKYDKGEIKPQKQDESKATYTKLIEKDDGYVTLKEDPKKIYNKYRAYCVWPGLYTKVRNLEDFAGFETKIRDKNIIIKLKELSLKNDTDLVINNLQMPNKPPISWGDFVNGYVRS